MAADRHSISDEGNVGPGAPSERPELGPYAVSEGHHGRDNRGIAQPDDESSIQHNELEEVPAVSHESIVASSISNVSSPERGTDATFKEADNGSHVTSEKSGGPIKHRRKSSVKPDLSLDTSKALSASQPKAPQARQPSLNPSSTRSPVSMQPRMSSVRSPTSPRTRDRGFSLRRSILARNIQPESNGSPIELQPAGPSRGRVEPSLPTGSSGPSKKPDTMITVSPIVEQTPLVDPAPEPVKKSLGLSSLPHYESWVASKANSKGLRSQFHALKETLRKRILRIREIPPSKDGRHLVIDSKRRKNLIDDRTGHEYIDNTILSSRYTLYNFLPRQLFAQFSKLANFYFLCVSILQMIPGLSTTGTYTTIVPLLFFVTISIAKEGYDDLRRYRLDKAENNRTSYVLSTHGCTRSEGNDGNSSMSTANRWKLWVETKWRDIRVGDIVRLKRDDPAPADLVLLHAQGTGETAYVETMALDGETNLKSKHVSPPLAKSCRTVDDLARCNARLVVEDPNLDLYNFEGKVSVGDETLPLANSEIIYRGSILRNTSEAVGLVVYSGEECKIRMNATKNPRIKAPSLQTIVNKVVIILVIFVVVLAIFNTVAYQIWQENTEDKSWYLTDAGVAFFPILVSFIILFNTMIPLSLYVSLEIVKLFQMFLLNDIDMYDEASNTPMEARTSTINEELGQVNYIFSDKTGTLTNNSMRFRKMSVAGTAWLHDLDIQEEGIKAAARQIAVSRKRSKGKKPLRRRMSISIPGETSGEPGISPPSYSSPVNRNGSTASRWRSSAKPNISRPELNTRDMLQYIQERPHTVFALKARIFLLSIALCHTCFPEKKADGEIEYQAASPDEQALVRAAQELEFIMVDRQNTTITIKTFPSGRENGHVLETYQVLDVVEFSSSRKRMSIVVRMPDQRICVFCKGADSTLIPLLRQSGLAIAKAVEIEQRVNSRRSLEAQEALRRASETMSPVSRKNSLPRRSISIHRTSLGGINRSSMATNRLQPIRDEVDHWLRDRETEVVMSPADTDSIYYSPRPSGHYMPRQSHASSAPSSLHDDETDELVDEALVLDDAAVFERCFLHINDFATEGLRTLLYGYKYMEEDEYNDWKKIFLDASTSLVNRQEMTEKAGAMIERDLELSGATAIEDKLQDGVPEAIDRLRRAKIKLWMLTGDKRETAINIGHSCRLIKDYSTVVILDEELGDVSQRIAAATLDMNNGTIAHSVVVVDGRTLSQITENEPLRKLFLSLAILVDTVVCCRASPSQKASLVSSIRHKVKNAITLAIGDGANDIAMIQEAHVGIGITGKEGLQAARNSDYSIAQFRFLTKLLLVHGRWNYLRVSKYTLGTFWKEMLFYLTQALYQRYAGYTGTSLYESWSLSMFNTLFTSLPVIFLGIFEQDLRASTLLAVPELYHSLGHLNNGFKIKIYLAWVALASCQAVIIFFLGLGLYGQAIFTTGQDLYAMGDLTFTACIIVIATKIQFWEIHNKTYTCAISMFCSIGGWFLWNIILSSTYTNNVIYDVKDGFFDRFGRNPLWWLTLILIVAACWALEIGIKVLLRAYLPTEADVFRELQKDPLLRKRFEEAAAGLPPSRTSINDETDTTLLLKPARTAEEDRQREGEVQAILDERPRNSRAASGAEKDVDAAGGSGTVRQRKHSLGGDNGVIRNEPKVSFAVDVEARERELTIDAAAGDESDGSDSNGKRKNGGRRRSLDVNELLKRGFGSVRRSLDLV